jgi:porphobilinogen synthase
MPRASSRAATATRSLSIAKRPRRLRATEHVRALVRETRLTPDCFIYPMFVCEGHDVRRPIESMPGIFQLSVDEAVQEASRAREVGVSSVLLFGLPGDKDEVGSKSSDSSAPVQTAVRALKHGVSGLVVMTDVCLCEYTSHGHCGVLDGDHVVNDPTVERLAETALSHAEAGADFVAPSDMMDGRVGAIRSALDAAGFHATGIVSYSAKYCSSLYSPFRDAADAAPQFGDRRTHQMDPANVEEALRVVEIDIDAGADVVMVKPALPYLDVLRRVKDRFGVPTAAYQVSGEYSMLKAAAERGWLDEDRVLLETLTGIRRAGADMIITYYALHAARLLG